MLVYQRVQTMVLTPKSLRLPCRTSLKATVNHLQSPPANCPKLVEGWRGSFRWAWPGAGFSDPFFLFQRSWMWIRNLEPVDIRWYYIYICIYASVCLVQIYIYIWLVVLTILKNMSSSMGKMTSHIWNGIYIYTYITSGTEWLPPTKESACRRDGRYTIGASVLSNPTGWKDGKGLQKNFNIIHNIVII